MLSSKKILNDAMPGPHRRPRRGEKNRAAILLAAAQLATVRGLEGLSIGDLAAELSMSKSGLYAHFKSKQELQLAAIETAAEIFQREVLTPALSARPGLQRLLTLVDKYLSHIKGRVFPGGCFFAAVAAEMSMRPGPVRDRVLQTVFQWLALLEQCLSDAQRQSELDPAADTGQLVFEVEAMLNTANTLFLFSSETKYLEHARRGIAHVLNLPPHQMPAKRVTRAGK